MNKFLVCTAVGAALALSGCKTEVMQKRGYVPAPGAESEPAPVAETTAPAVKEAPAPAKQAPESFEPMTGVKASGGVDSAPRRSAKVSGKAAVPGGVYVVRPGDNPGKIARKCHVRVADLLEENHLDQNSARKLRVGQKLVIPGKSGAAVSAKTAKGVKPAKKAAKKGNAAMSAAPVTGADGMYAVRPGDNPGKIARKFKVSRNDLLKANNMTEADARKLKIGQKLVIPGRSAVSAPAAPAAPAVPAVPPTVETAPAAEAVAPAAVPVAAPAVAAEKETENVAALGNTEMTVVKEQSVKASDFAARYGITVDELRKLNPGVKDETFTNGQMLFVPKK